MLYPREAVPGSTHDVIIVGTGMAGMAAALAAREAGVSPLVIDKAPDTSKSGNTRFSGGVFRAPTGEHSPASLVEELMRVTGRRADPQLAGLMYREAEQGIQWLREHGVRQSTPDERPDFKNSRLSFHASGNGYGLVDSLFPRLAAAGIEARFDTKAVELLSGMDGRVEGLRVKTREGYRDLMAKAVVLASGGFQADTSARVAYLGRDAGSLIVRGSRYNTGDGLRMAQSAGAQSFGDWGGFHSAVLDARSPPVEAGETNINTYPFSLMVNRDGERFVDEGEDFFDTTYVKFGKAILQQPGRVAYCIFDAKVAEQNLVYGLHEEFEPIDGGSLSLLAQKLDIPAERLNATVAAFNAAVQPGEFDPARKDGKRTVGIHPPKSNWAVPVDTPPFFAYPITGGITFTLGGLRVDTRARVVDTESRAIPGLFAAGEIMGGLFYDNYPGGASLVRALVFGRIAGREAAALCGR